MRSSTGLTPQRRGVFGVAGRRRTDCSLHVTAGFGACRCEPVETREIEPARMRRDVAAGYRRGKRRTFARHAREADLAAQQRAELAAQRQAETGSLDVLLQRIFDLAE